MSQAPQVYLILTTKLDEKNKWEIINKKKNVFKVSTLESHQ